MEKSLFTPEPDGGNVGPAGLEHAREQRIPKPEIKWEDFAELCNYVQRAEVEIRDPFVVDMIYGRRAANWPCRIPAATRTYVEHQMPGDEHCRIFMNDSEESMYDVSSFQTVDFIRFSGDIPLRQRMQKSNAPIHVENAVSDDPCFPLDDVLPNRICSVEAIGPGLEFALRKFQLYDFMWNLDLVGSRWKIQPLKSIEHGFPGAVEQEVVVKYMALMMEKDFTTAESMQMQGIVETLMAGTIVEVVKRYQSKSVDLIKVKREEDLKELWTVTAALSSPALP